MQIKWCKQFCRSNCTCLSEFPKPYCYCLLAVISTSADLSWICEEFLISTCQNKCFLNITELKQSHRFCRSPPMRRHYRDGGGIWIWPGLHYGAYHWHRLPPVLHRADLPAQPVQHHADAAVQTCRSIHGEQTRKTSKSAVVVCLLTDRRLLLLESHGTKPLFSCMQVINLSEHSDDLSRMDHRVKLNCVSCDC